MQEGGSGRGCGAVGQQPASALAVSIASRYTRSAPMAWGAARPGACASRVTASRYALGAEGGRSAPERPHLLLA